MREPPYSMTEQDLIEWIYENDFEYYYRLLMDNEHNTMIRLKEVFEDLVYEAITEAVTFDGWYNEFVLDEEDDLGGTNG